MMIVHFAKNGLLYLTDDQRALSVRQSLISLVSPLLTHSVQPPTIPLILTLDPGAVSHVPHAWEWAL